MATIPLPHMPQPPGVTQPVLAPRKQMQVDFRSAFAAQREAAVQPLMPEGMFDMGEAGQAWGQTLMTLGKVGMSMAKDWQDMLDKKAALEADDEYTKTTTDYAAKIQAEKPPAEWAPLMQEHAGKERDRILGNYKLSARAHDELALRLTKLGNDSTIRLAATAMQTEVKQTRDRYTGRIGQYLEAGQYDHALTTNEEMTKLALQSPEQAAANSKNIIAAQQGKKRADLISEDPTKALEAFKNKEQWATYGLDEKSAPVAQKIAQLAVDEKDQAAISTYKTAVTGGTPPADALKAVSGNLSAGTLKKLTDNIEAERKMNDPSYYLDWHQKIHAYDPKRDASGLERATMRTSIALDFDGEKERELLRQMDAKVEQPGQSTTRPTSALSHAFNEKLSDLKDGLKNGLFGDYKVVFTGDNLFWDQEERSWKQRRPSWEQGPRDVPIRLDHETAQRLTHGLLRPGEAVVDLDAREKADRKVTVILNEIAKKIDAGKYTSLPQMQDDFNSLVSASSERKLKEMLRNRQDDNAPPPSTSPPTRAQLDALRKKRATDPRPPLRATAPRATAPRASTVPPLLDPASASQGLPSLQITLPSR